MSSALPPHDRDARPMQTRADLGGQGRTGAEPRHDPRRDPQLNERFGKSLQKAMARKPATEVEENRAAVAANPLLPAFQTEVAKPAPAPAPRGEVVAIAERIERYLRGAEGAAALKAEGMVIRLPQNALGLVQVTARIEGDVLRLELGLDDPARLAAMQAQIGVMGQVLGQRLPRLPLRLSLAGEDEGEAPRMPAFDPLMPRGRLG